MLNSLEIFTYNFITKNGTSSILKKYVEYAMQEFKELLNWKIISKIRKLFIKRIKE